MNTKQLGAIGMLLVAVLAHGQEINHTLYVNPSGDDANDGSISSPFRTLSTAFVRLTNNTRLVISGSFTNACVPPGLKLPVGPMQLTNLSNIELAGTEGATLYFTGYGNGLHVRQFTNLTFSGLTFVGDRPALQNMNPHQITVAGAIAITGTNNSGLIIRDCQFLDWPDQAVTAWLGNWGAAHAHTTDNVWIQNNVFRNIGSTNFPAGSWMELDGACISTFFRNHVWVQNNTATKCLRFFESEPAGDTSVANLVVGDWHVTDNVLLDHFCFLVWAHDNYGVSTRDVWVERNYVKQTVWLDESCVALASTTNAFVRDNTFVGVSACVAPYASDNIVVEGNIFDGGENSLTYHAPLSSTLVPCWNLTIRSNTFNQVRVPLLLGAVNTVVENNVFKGVPASKSVAVVVLNGGHAYGHNMRGWATNLTFANNSFFPPFNPGSQWWLFTAGSNRLDQFTFSGNQDFCSTPVTRMFTDPPWTYARSNMFIDQPAGSAGSLNGNVKAATGSRWVVDGVTYVNTGDATWEPEPLEATGPMILSQPRGQSQIPGLSATFTVRSGGTPPLSYQWQFNGEDIPGATASSFTITNVQSTNLGSYRVLVANSIGSIVSSDAPLEWGQIASWGSSSYPGQCDTAAPIGATNVLAAAAGQTFSLALKADGTLLGWGGYNLNGETTVPEELVEVVAIAAGGDTGLALSSYGTVVAWGDNTFGQTDVPWDLANVVAIAAGTYHCLALKADGTVVAWGGRSGEAAVPAGLQNVVAIAAGTRFSLALKADGTVTAWGYGAVSPPPLTGAVAIAAGVDHALALLGNGTVVAWGQNNLGQTSVPTRLTNVVAVAAGAYDNVALLANGTAVGWGAGSSGLTSMPTALPNGVAVSVGNYHSLALVGNGPPVLNAPANNPTLSEAGFQFSLPTQSGRVYALEYKNSLADTNWTAFPLVAGNGGELLLTDSSPTNSQRFYRVRRW